ncbi:MAG: glycosyltransferase family 39 protein [Coriobacteriia bacterium]
MSTGHLVPGQRRAMFALAWWVAPLVFVAAYVVRLFRAGQVVNFLDDRWINVPAAFNYVQWGFTGPDNWFTQPAKHLFMYWSILAFGNDPVGWSMRQVVFGAAIVLLTFLLARRLFRVPFPAIMAAVLVGLDPLFISFSRAGSEDPIAVTFILAALLFWLRAHESRRPSDLLAAGVLIGLGSAVRWYALLVAALMLAFALWDRRHDGAGAIVRTSILLFVAPFCSYLVWFLPWLSRGYSLREWYAIQLDAFILQGSGAFPTFDPALTPLTGSSRWFVQWMGVGTSSTAVEGSGAFTVIMNDPVVWILFLPAIAYLMWSAYRRRSIEYWLVVGTFIVLYGFFVVVNRPIYLYSAMAVVPFGALALSYAVGRFFRRRSFYALGALLVWSLYLYPLTSGLTVPLWAYAWLLAKFGLAGGGS